MIYAWPRQYPEYRQARFPDLIMMDGGKGQVNVALRVLDELGLHIPVCGMVKDDNHRTRGLYYHNREIPIDRLSFSLSWDNTIWAFCAASSTNFSFVPFLGTRI